MKHRATAALALWLAVLAVAAVLAARARYVADLSALLPVHPTHEQRLLADLLRSGPASTTILIAIDGADAAARAHASVALAARLRREHRFVAVENGDAREAARERRFIFAHRYLLSDAVTPAHFTARGLQAAIGDTIDELATPAGPWLEALLPRDPTGEIERIAGRWGLGRGPRIRDGVWSSTGGHRAVLVAQTRALGSDTDGQARALAAIGRAFRAARGTITGLRLRLSGPPVFAVDARARIKQSVLRLSLLGGMLVVTLLLVVYRSILAVLLGLLPVLSGALVGVGAVAAVFGTVQGLTLGFGVTLIGESVDYAIYFFIQSGERAGGDGAADWRRRFWPTVRLGAATSVVGFATLLPSGFAGLAQLGVYSISGLLAAALTTRFVLPHVSPRRLRLRDIAPLGRALRNRIPRPALAHALAAALALASLGALWIGHGGAWSHELSALSPVSAADRRFDTRLRADLGAPDVRDIVVVRGADREAALRGAERAGQALRKLVDDRFLDGFDSPANYLPSLAVQRARRRSLPPAATLAANLRRATQRLPLHDKSLSAFLSDVKSARHAPLLRPADLAGTSLGTAFDGLMLRRAGRWIALLPLHAPSVDGHPAPIDLGRVRAALGGTASVLDLKAEANALYAGYLRNAQRASAAGLLAIALLLCISLRSVRRALRILAPLVLAVLVVAAVLSAGGVKLNLLHLVGMLLIVAIGSNYALFFERHAGTDDGTMTGSLAVANAATVIGFGLLSLSDVPLLRDLGMTVAPGALLALLFSALIAAPARYAP